MSQTGRVMQDRIRRSPSLAFAASLPLAGVVSLAAGCAADGGPSDCCPHASVRTVERQTRPTSSEIQLASFQDGVGDSSDETFFDPLLDDPRTDPPEGSSTRRTPRMNDAGDEFADSLLDAPPAEDAPAEEAEVARDASTIELAEAVALAVARSPRAQAARSRAAATAARLPQVTALDDPMLMSTSYPIRDQSLQTAGGRIQTGVQLTQRIPWLEKLGARGEVVRREVQAAATEVATAELQAALAARTAWFEAWFADRAVEVTLRNRELLEQLLDVAVARVRTGGAQTDVLRSQLEIDRLDDRLLTLRRQRDVARADWPRRCDCRRGGASDRDGRASAARRGRRGRRTVRRGPALPAGNCSGSAGRSPATGPNAASPAWPASRTSPPDWVTRWSPKRTRSPESRTATTTSPCCSDSPCRSTGTRFGPAWRRRISASPRTPGSSRRGAGRHAPPDPPARLPAGNP